MSGSERTTPDTLADVAELHRLVGEMNGVIARLNVDHVAVHFGGSASRDDPLNATATVSIAWRLPGTGPLGRY